MNEIERLLAERACERLMIDYCRCVDTRDFARLVTLFVADGVLRRPLEGEIKGREAIGDFFAKLPNDTFVHVASNLLVNVTGAATATASSYVTVCRSTERNAEGLPLLTPPYLVATYLDRFTVEDGAWKIAFRDTIFTAKS